MQQDRKMLVDVQKVVYGQESTMAINIKDFVELQKLKLSFEGSGSSFCRV